MIGPAPGTKVMVATKPVDFRKGADSLAALVEAEYGGKPYSGVIYVFRAKRADRIKLDTRNNRDFGRLMIRSLFDEVSVGI